MKNISDRKKEVENGFLLKFLCTSERLSQLTKTMKNLIAGILFLSIASHSLAFTAELMDSIREKKVKNSHWRLTARLHSKGIFNFGGRIGSENPTGDINFTYDRKNWGFLFFKGQDFIDHSTFYNFSLATVYTNIRLSSRVTMTPSIGTLLEQANGVADKGSDAVFLLTTTYKINSRFSLEQMSLLGNLIIEPEARDWVNRLRLLYTYRHVDVITALWHNNSVFDHSSFWSTGLTVSYARVRIGEHAFLNTGISGLLVLQTSDETVNPKKNVVMVTVGLQVFN